MAINVKIIFNVKFTNTPHKYASEKDLLCYTTESANILIRTQLINSALEFS